MKRLTSQFFAHSVFACLFFLALQLQAFDETKPMTVTARLENSEMSPGQQTRILINLDLPPGYHAFADRLALNLKSEGRFKLAKFKAQPLVEFIDPQTKKATSGIQGASTADALIEFPTDLKSNDRLLMTLTYQACTDTFCLFPVRLDLDLPFSIKTDTLAQNSLAPAALAARLENSSLPWALLICFLAGILTSFTPCIFPMIPITLSLLAQGAQNRSRFKTFLTSLIYVLGIALTYSLLGVIAATTGSMFGSAMSSPWVIGLLVVVFLAMSASMFGLFEIKAPAALDQLLAKQKTKGLLGAFFTGALSGLAASPCVGPVLVAILSFVAKTQNVLSGFLMLFVFALGLGQIFIVLGLSTGLIQKLPRSGKWLNMTKWISGLLMLGVALYYAQFLIPKDYLSLKSNEPSFKVAALQWLPLSKEKLTEAKSQGKPVIIDFSAEWCGACHELEDKTFTNQAVQTQAASFVLLRFDLTQDSDEGDMWKKEFKIFGLPWVAFINRKGEWIQNKTLAGFEGPQEFLERMRSTLR